MIPIGFLTSGELLVVFLIILLLFGAKKLPELARSMGLAKKEFHKAANEVSSEVDKLKEPPADDSQQKPKAG